MESKEQKEYDKKPIFAIVHCHRGDVTFTISMRSLKNNENVCSHCPKRYTCIKHLNIHLKPYEMLRISMHVPKEIKI